MTVSQASVEHSWSGPSPSERALIPATLKSASIFSNRSTQAATLLRTASSSRTSATQKPASGNSAASERHSSFTPTMNTLSCAPQRRAVAAAIPDDPVTRRTSLTWPLFKKVFEALAIGLVERFQLLGSAGVSDELMAGQQHWLDSSRQQGFSSGAADHINNGCSRNRGNRPCAPFQALQLDDAVTRRTLIVDDQIGAIDKLLARRMGRRRLLAMCLRDNGNHRQPALLRSRCHLDDP